VSAEHVDVKSHVPHHCKCCTRNQHQYDGSPDVYQGVQSELRDEQSRPFEVCDQSVISKVLVGVCSSLQTHSIERRPKDSNVEGLNILRLGRETVHVWQVSERRQAAEIVRRYIDVAKQTRGLISSIAHGSLVRRYRREGDISRQSKRHESEEGQHDG